MDNDKKASKNKYFPPLQYKDAHSKAALTEAGP